MTNRSDILRRAVHEVLEDIIRATSALNLDQRVAGGVRHMATLVIWNRVDGSSTVLRGVIRGQVHEEVAAHVRQI
jgi:hypothetical protein